ncbi:hypothetical protein LCGC14_0593770 [marine sediment metagenome]|uniref:Uncharacterized protein n=1 Tax=marine sediment metagenome TaxID=412755 RepID=A0A0F9RWI8_9ZZZZ
MKNKDFKLEKPPVQGCAGLAVIAIIIFFISGLIYPAVMMKKKYLQNH